MEVRAFCIALLTVMILLCAQDQEVDAAFLRISPNRLQFFEYESVTFYCEGVFYCDAKYKLSRGKPSCCTTNDRTSRGPNCTLESVYAEDSGKYWCEEGGKRRNIININVAPGSVILESPAHPVMEGEDVTLSCRTKISSSNITANFYQDGVHKWRSTTGNLTLKPVSMLDQGLYKCHISGVGESPQSWLSVGRETFSVLPTVKTEDHKDINPASSSSPNTQWIIISVSLMLLLLAVGLLCFGRFLCARDICSHSQARPDSDSSQHQTVSVQAIAPEESQEIYANVPKNRKKKAQPSVPSPAQDPIDTNVCYAAVQVASR